MYYSDGPFLDLTFNQIFKLNQVEYFPDSFNSRTLMINEDNGLEDSEETNH
jgi:hypothetical protein